MRKYTHLNEYPGYFILLGFAIIIFWHLYEFGGGPQTWDDVLYLEMALNFSSASSLVHRYVHVFLLRLNILSTGDALDAARVYWALMYVTTVIAVFFSTYALAKYNRVFLGVIASILFVALSGLMPYAGVVYADFTLMMLVALSCLAYHAWVRTGSRRILKNSLGVVVVLLFLAAIFTKETAVILLPFVMVVVFDGCRQVACSGKRKNRVPVAIGVLVAVLGALYILAVVFDEVGELVQDVSSGVLNPMNLVALLGRAVNVKLGWDSYLDYAASKYIFLFTAFVLGVFRWRLDRQSRALMVSWTIPFTLLIVLTLINSVTDWGIQPRYIYPALPVLAIWGAFMFNPVFSDSDTGREYGAREPVISETGCPAAVSAVFWVIVCATWFAIVLWYFAEPVVRILEHSVWTREEVYEAIMEPISIITMLSIVLASIRFRVGQHIALVLALIALTGPPIDSQLWQLRSGIIQEKTDERFRWLRSLEEVYGVTEETRIFISQRVYDSLGVGGRSDGSSTRLMNIYYNMDRKAALLSQTGDLNRMRSSEPDLVILVTGEWQAIRSGDLGACYTELEPVTRIDGVVFLQTDKACVDRRDRVSIQIPSSSRLFERAMHRFDTQRVL